MPTLDGVPGPTQKTRTDPEWGSLWGVPLARPRANLGHDGAARRPSPSRAPRGEFYMRRPCGGTLSILGKMDKAIVREAIAHVIHEEPPYGRAARPTMQPEPWMLCKSHVPALVLLAGTL